MDIDTIIAQAQALTDALVAFKNQTPTTPAPATVVEVDVKESDGSEVVTTPQADQASLSNSTPTA